MAGQQKMLNMVVKEREDVKLWRPVLDYRLEPGMTKPCTVCS